MPSPPIYILGVGNLGKLLAHSLRKAHPELPITLLFHRRSLIDEWEKAGRQVEIVRNGVSEKIDRIEHEVIDGSEKGKGMGRRIENLIVTTKTYKTVEAMGPLRERLGRGSTVLFCQNGIGTVDEVATDIFPKPDSQPTYLAGIFNHGVYSTSTFSSVHAGLSTAVIGRVSPELVPAESSSSDTPLLAQKIVECPELATSFVSEQKLLHVQLQKLAVNAVINPLTAVLDCYNGELFQNPVIRVLVDSMVVEISEVILAILASKATFIDPLIQKRFSADQLDSFVADIGAQTAKNISSMRQDSLAGRQTEIEYINGYIMRQGARFHVSTPVNGQVVELVRRRTRIKADEIPGLFQLPIS